MPAWASARLGRIFELSGGQLDHSGAGSSNDGLVEHMPRSGRWDGVGRSSEYMIAFKNTWSSLNVIFVCKRRESTSGSDDSVST